MSYSIKSGASTKLFRLLQSSTCLLSLVGEAALVATIGSTTPATAQTSSPPHNQTIHSFDIKTGDLQKILRDIAARGDLSLIFEHDLSGVKTQQGIIGSFDLRDALQRALDGTSYQLRQLDATTYSIVLREVSSPTQIDEIIVTAGRAKRSAKALPASVIVISPDEIAQHVQGGGDAATLVGRFVPGLASSNQTLSGASQTFRGRGVQVLVDGHTRNTPLRNVSRTLTVIDLNQIERIEVVPGARSDYGNGATGGTLNFITKSATKDHEITISAGVSAFTENVGKSLAPEASVTFTGTEGSLDYAAILTAEMTQDAYTGDGDLAPSDPLIGQGGLDNTKNFSLSLKGGWNATPNKRLQVSFNIVELNQEPEFNSDYSTDPVSADPSSPYTGDSIRERSKYFALDYSDSDTALGELSTKFFADDIRKRFALSPISAANPAVPANAGTTDANPDGQSENLTQRLGIRVTMDSSLGNYVEGMKLTWGGDLDYDETSQDLQDGQHRAAPMQQIGVAGFGQLSVPFSIFEFSGGLRYEYFDLKIEDFTRPAYAFRAAPGVIVPVAAVDVTGGSHTYRELVFNAGVVAHVSDPVDAFVNYSEGFSLPDVGSITSRAGFGGVPADFSSFSPKANVVRSLETGIRYKSDTLRAELSAYVSKSDYGTTFDLATNSISQQKERIWGVEFSGEYDVRDWIAVGGVASFIKGEYDSDGDGQIDADLPANRIPSETKLSLYTDMNVLEDLNIRVTGNLEGGRSGDAGATSGRFDIDPSFTLDVSARYPLFGGEVAVGMLNAFDSGSDNVTATAVRGFPVTEYGRRAVLSYTKTF
ncbi:MAG: TonB-dependent receptor [Sneathiella sp.]